MNCNIGIVILAVGIIPGIAACGDSDSGAGCDYLETMDLTNNTNVGGTVENTSLAFGTSPVVLCGEGNSGHYDSEDLDYDAYTITVAAAGNATLMLSATEPPSLSLFDVSILDSGLRGKGRATLAGSASVQLLPGSYRLEIRVQNPTPISSSFSYRITLTPAM